MQSTWGPDWSADSRCEVVYAGLDLRRFDPRVPSDVARQALNISPAAKVILHLGSFQPAKNHARLIAVFRRLRVRVPQAQLVLVGRDAGTRGATEALVRRSGLEEAVSFLGERDDMVELLRAADLMIFPSKREGLPGSILEALAAGVPVVASDLSGIQEIAEIVSQVRCISLAEGDDSWADAAEDALNAAPHDSLGELRGTRFDLDLSAEVHARIWTRSG
jgi:glycosyltransferase involved in cell wall biosynthesis